ncbi:class I SAM-dependent methyltransferase [Aquisalibacillus elongatus]|uniref:Methyltransferase family protein n=1 Tax=Aquisalibacillus elongatus TaxID=485577 RepID=A0A3N5BL43_9BACI|nr:class I SAM-dependent methyltransferase [Aquisalibacillus elongatus]RPF50408.1 methyltransferase family protein [Aquisalibacillus elongatus]
MKEINASNNLDMYDNPSSYDDEYESYQAEIPLLLKWASVTKGTIIDLACGTGRATIPLANEGYKLMGIDIHQGMLDRAKEKASRKNLKIEWIQQDCTQLNLKTKASLIYTVGNSFQHFLTNENQDALLSSVRNHLTDGGIFIFGTRFPNSEELLSSPEEEYVRTYKDNTSQLTVDEYHISKYDALTQIQHNSTIKKNKDSEGEIVQETTSNISLRYVYPKEMERLLHIHGLQILHLYKGWNETPITNESNEMIYICRKIND